MILLSQMPLPFWGGGEGYIPDVYFSRLLDSTEYVTTHISTHTYACYHYMDTQHMCTHTHAVSFMHIV